MIVFHYYFEPLYYFEPMADAGWAEALLSWRCATSADGPSAPPTMAPSSGVIVDIHAAEQ